MQLYGNHVDVNEHGEPINGDTLLILFNGDQEIDIPFVLPQFDGASQWQRLLDTANPKADESLFPVGEKYPLRSCSVAILRALTPEAQSMPIKPAEMLPAARTNMPGDLQPRPLLLTCKLPRPKAAAVKVQVKSTGCFRY